MRVTVFGCGRWGTFHAWHADHIGHDVMLWGRPGSKNLQELQATGRNAYQEIPASVTLTDDLEKAVRHAELCLVVVSSQGMRSLLERIRNVEGAAGKVYVLCMKGLEIETGKRLSEVFCECMPKTRVAVWVGPGHVQDFLRGIPNCMVIASSDAQVTELVIEAMKSPLIRYYYGTDLIGTELGAAVKNVVGLAAGMLDGFHYGSLKGALMARGTKELSRLVEAMGGDRMTIYGLCHLGDYEATLFSPHSHNRRFGEDLIRGIPFTKLAEGVHTVRAVMELSKEYHVELPIARAVYDIVHGGEDPKTVLTGLFLREQKPE
ncbi:NAD(P)H-dependent glycerol-3-phosphate dehydrogenase [Selenomonas sp. TAMA-11512]|uniref:NAD(P)H-dependent glycerol-3-phosphate dehydrogenase n=1 Tax=Selenomonas sp. TAMA-11512 TaxID=3095337 RepID=UPI00308BC1EB|nr:NAD(P)H-dependent glycerol-3-phosphate dehydrogenase [Selenomonas sp. TAMA-11512]